MKNYFLYIIIALLTPNFVSYGQESETKTLFNSDEVKNGGYGALELKTTQIADQTGLLVGGKGGWIINSVFSIGGAGYGLVTSRESFQLNSNPDSTYYTRIGYGGLLLEYINNSDDLIHFTANLLIGVGGAENTLAYSKNKNDQSTNYVQDNWKYDNCAFFVLEPGVTADLNVTKWFRIGLGASYRIVSNLEIKNFTSSDFQKFSGSLSFKFGSF